VPGEEEVKRLPAALQAQLASDPYVYFRFINVPWERAACEQFADIVPSLPAVRLHGDPHLEQYAFTSTSRGLDDFDDSATGPFVLDLTRFLASIRLALRARGWNSSATAAADALFAGYRAGLGDPDGMPPDPAVVARLRETHPRSPAAFLAWAESLMLPLDPNYEIWLPAVSDALNTYARRAKPGAPPDYFRLKKVGRLKMGVGSALTAKVLLRLEGPTLGDEDDLIVEAKEARALRSVPCLTVAPSPAFRVVTGAEQIGRLHHELLMVLPRLNPANRNRPETWWLRSWEASYREVDVADYQSADELIAVARDVGVQLGRGHFHNLPGGHPFDTVHLLDRFEARIRLVAETQTAQLLKEWAAFAARSGR